MRLGASALLLAVAVFVGAPIGRSQAAGQPIDLFQPIGLPTEQLDGLDWTFVTHPLQLVGGEPPDLPGDLLD